MTRLIMMLLILSVSIQAQIPTHIKPRIQKLVYEADKSSNKKQINHEIMTFLASSPNEIARQGAQNLMKSENKSDIVKSIVDALIFSTATSEVTSSDDNYILLRNVDIIDMISEQPKKGDILIKNDRIETINYSNTLATPAGAVTYDLTGKYLIPGLIDAHVHITHGTLDEARHHLHEALRHGVTGVRDMGGDGRMLTVLKKNMLIGEDIGSDVFFSTIIAGPEFFEKDPRPQQVAKGAVAGEVPWQRAITHETDLTQVIAEAKGLGATAIKVYLNVDKDLFKKVADEAKRQGLKVWAHAVVPPTKGIHITNGGAEVMSHAGDLVQYEYIDGPLMGRHDFASQKEAMIYKNRISSVAWSDDDPQVKNLFNAMRENNSILDATLHIYNRKGRSPKKLEKAQKTVKIAHDMGVKVGAGSDNMITTNEHGQTVLNIHDEIEQLTKAGLSNLAALRAATIINAEIIGEESDVGTIEAGKLANVVILNQNPLKEITNTNKIHLVIKRGQVIQ